jgi:hypothetical protein
MARKAHADLTSVRSAWFLPSAQTGQPTNCRQDEAARQLRADGGSPPREESPVPEESSVPEESVMAETTVAKTTVTKTTVAETTVAKSTVAKSTVAKSTVAKSTVAAKPAMGWDHARAKRCAAVRTGNRKARGGSGSGGGLCRRDAAEQHRASQRAGTQSASGRAAD